MSRLKVQEVQVHTEFRSEYRPDRRYAKKTKLHHIWALTSKGWMKFNHAYEDNAYAHKKAALIHGKGILAKHWTLEVQ